MHTNIGYKCIALYIPLYNMLNYFHWCRSPVADLDSHLHRNPLYSFHHFLRRHFGTDGRTCNTI